MSKKADFEAKIAKIAEPLAKDLGLELVAIEFVREGEIQYLRVLIDKRFGVTIDECEEMSRRIDPILTEKGLMEEVDTFEVSSPGLDRPLKKEADFIRHMDEIVDVGLYQAMDGEKTIVGILRKYEKGNLTLEREEDTIEIEKEKIAVVKQHLEF